MATTFTVRDEVGVRFTNTGVLVLETCPVCHVHYAIPESLHQRALLRTQASKYMTLSVYCPNGHTWSFIGENREQELQHRLDEQKRATDAALDKLNAERGAHQATEAERRRIVRRVSNGVCIHCHRTFQNLLRHMETQHVDGGDDKPLSKLALAYVHKQAYRREYDVDGKRWAKCWALVPNVKIAMRWADVTCPKCLARKPELAVGRVGLKGRN